MTLGLSRLGGWVTRGHRGEVITAVILHRIMPLPLVTDKHFTDMFVNEGVYSIPTDS